MVFEAGWDAPEKVCNWEDSIPMEEGYERAEKLDSMI
jgi:hypothetical protein